MGSIPGSDARSLLVGSVCQYNVTELWSSCSASVWQPMKLSDFNLGTLSPDGLVADEDINKPTKWDRIVSISSMFLYRFFWVGMG